jgi:ubiquinone biosynthesis protein
MGMAKSAQARINGATLKLRQQEVSRCFAVLGLGPGPHRLVRNGANLEDDRIRRLCQALGRLGPIFTSFGLYLSTRIDLLGPRDCRALASLPDGAEQPTGIAILDLIKQELGAAAGGFRDIEVTPFHYGWLDQEHRAWLSNGEAVTIKLISPEVQELYKYDSQLLHLALHALVGKDCDPSQIESAVDDFISSLELRMDLTLAARWITAMSKDTRVFGMLRAPFVHKELSTSKVLTLDRLPGQSVQEILRTLPSANEDTTTTVKDDELYDLAHHICVAWLRQALLGSLFPAEPSPTNITILPNNQIIFTDGLHASLPSEAKANLWDYLISAVTENPDRACSGLLKELVGGNRSIGADELRQRFRQLVPFRDSDWDDGADRTNLADHLFLHWRLASRGGYRPHSYLPSFYRGLFMIATVSQRLTPSRDAFRAAVQDLRILAATERFREVLSVRELGARMDRYLAIMPDLPQRFDETLTLMAEGSARMRLETAGDERPKRHNNSFAVITVLLMALIACALLSRYIAATGLAGPWINGASAIAFLMLGAMVLRAATR